MTQSRTSQNATQVPDAPTPRIASVPNFRDLAGSGYRTAHGNTMRRGVFYRANVLAPADDDIRIVNSLGLTAVYDVRSDAEAAKTPVTVPPSAKYTHIPILPGTIQDAALSITTINDAHEFMRVLNRYFVTDAASRAGFSQLLRSLAATPGPQLFHCTAGKDRTGWAAALLHTIADVPQETIVEDYLLTNTYSTAHVDSTLAQIATLGNVTNPDVVRVMLSVHESYLAAAFEEVERSYSSVENYLVSGLELSSATIDALKLKLVV